MKDILMRLGRRVKKSDVRIDFVCMSELEAGINDYLCGVLIPFMTLLKGKYESEGGLYIFSIVISMAAKPLITTFWSIIFQSY